MRKFTLFFSMLFALTAAAQWDGYTVKSISTTPAKSLETGYYVMQNNHSSGRGWLYTGTANNATGNELRKTKVRSTFQDIDYVANINGGESSKISQPITTYDRNLLVFKIVNNGDGTCTIQGSNGLYIPSLASRANNWVITLSSTAGQLNFHQYIEGYFSFEEGGMGIATVAYGSSYTSSMVAYSARTALDGSNPFTDNASQSFVLYKVDMEEPAAQTDFSSNVVSEILPWFESHVGEWFGLTEETVNAYADRVNAATTSCTEEEYNALKAIVEAGKCMPETGYYRLQSAGLRHTGPSYVSYGSTGLSGKNAPCLVTVASAQKEADAGTVLFLQKQANGSYLISTQGFYVQDESSYNQTFSLAEGVTHPFYLLSTAPGNLLVSADGTLNTTFNESNWRSEPGFINNGVACYNSSSASSYWSLEQATSVTLSLNAAGEKSYGTAYLPFDVVLGEEATAYVVQIVNGGEAAQLVRIGNNIPAGTPVVLVSDEQATSVEATITSGLPAIEEQNDLIGQYPADLVAGAHSNILVLSAVEGEVGFYTLSSSARVAANRAFLSGSMPVRSLIFASDDVTAIASDHSAPVATQETFDLQGRRVQATQPGVYIVGGKKVFVK